MAEYHNEARLLYLQKTSTDFFHLWRAGYDEAQKYDRQKRAAILRHMRFPRSGEWVGHQEMNWGPPLHRIVKKARRRRDRYRDQANRNAMALDQNLQFADLRVGRILGWGGLGIACEVDGTKPNGETLKVVCKVALHGTEQEAMAKEKRNHIETAGARHIVQRVVLEENPRRTTSSSREGRSKKPRASTLGSVGEGVAEMTDVDRARVMEDVRNFNRRMLRKQLDARDDMLFIEFMQRGDLYGCLCKASMSDTPFPDQLLWQIFDCLFKGVIAMAYPGIWHNPEEDPEHHNVSQKTESCEHLWELDQVDSTMVHFDLDPQNILIGDFDGDEHSILPVVKIADLGLCLNVDIRFRNDPHRMWAARRRGKFTIYTPEQFTEEWDYVRRTPFSEHGVQKATAGNYHWWTNLYQVAQVMWQLITLHSIEYPPVAVPYDTELPDGTLETQWSYGTGLLDPHYDYVDRDLRELVMSCMNHNPTDRPDMPHIEEVLREKIHRQGEMSAEERKAVQDFCVQLFADPPPPAAVPATLSAVAAAQLQL
ncbi:kinase-like protein [Coniochaeta sp. PMI_546]|nr:kinase-like protein [Coniochaeta sp. PMI_546]